MASPSQPNSSHASTPLSPASTHTPDTTPASDDDIEYTPSTRDGTDDTVTEDDEVFEELLGISFYSDVSQIACANQACPVSDAEEGGDEEDDITQDDLLDLLNAEEIGTDGAQTVAAAAGQGDDEAEIELRIEEENPAGQGAAAQGAPPPRLRTMRSKASA